MENERIFAYFKNCILVHAVEMHSFPNFPFSQVGSIEFEGEIAVSKGRRNFSPSIVKTMEKEGAS